MQLHLNKPRFTRGIALLLSASWLSATSSANAQEGPTTVPPPLSVTAPSPQSNPDGSGLSIGADVSPGSHAFFVGGVQALNGDLSADGFLVRASFTAGQYDEGNNEVSFEGGNLLIGYQHAFDGTHVAFFVGPDVVHNGKGASPDVRGTSWAARGIAEFSTPLSSRLDLIGWGTFTTFESQYYVQGRALYRPGDNYFRIGPEVSFLGGDTWSQRRVGGHAEVPLPFGGLGASVGHAWTRRGGDNDGVYANLILSISF